MTEQPTGLIDLDAQGLRLLREATEHLEKVFESYGYARVEPPAVERADAFLERSGEETRRRAYFFDDPAGQEHCLRPDLTIPVCRMLLRAGLPQDDVTRLSYAGPVFRHDAPGPGRFRQFHQAGIELIGRTQPVEAEAETVAIALEAAKASGVTTPLMILGDVDLFRTLLDHYKLPEHLKQHLKHDLLKADGANPASAILSGDEPAGAHLPQDMAALVETVATIGKDKAVQLIESFLSVAEIDRIGSRGIDEIVERLLERSRAAKQTLPKDVAQQIQAFLEIAGEPREALDRMRAFAQQTGAPLDPLIDQFHQRLDLLEAYGVDTATSMVAAAFTRDMDYYSGFIFEIAHDDDDGVWPLGGGGRYDGLMASLDPSANIPAIGFALGIERLIMATKRDAFSGPLGFAPRLHAHVTAKPPTTALAVAEAARALRKAGWRVSVDLGRPDGSRGHQTIQAPHLIELETGDAGTVYVMIRNRTDDKHQTMPLSELSSFVEKSR